MIQTCKLPGSCDLNVVDPGTHAQTGHQSFLRTGKGTGAYADQIKALCLQDRRRRGKEKSEVLVSIALTYVQQVTARMKSFFPVIAEICPVMDYRYFRIRNIEQSAQIFFGGLRNSYDPRRLCAQHAHVQSSPIVPHVVAAVQVVDHVVDSDDKGRFQAGKEIGVEVGGMEKVIR